MKSFKDYTKSTDMDTTQSMKYKPHAEVKIKNALNDTKHLNYNKSNRIGYHGSRQKFTKFDKKKTDEFAFHFANQFYGTDQFTYKYGGEKNDFVYLYICEIPKEYKFLRTTDLGFFDWYELYYSIKTYMGVKIEQGKTYRDILSKELISFVDKKDVLFGKNFNEFKKLVLKDFDGLIYRNQCEYPLGQNVRCIFHEKMDKVKIIRRIPFIYTKDKVWEPYYEDEISDFDNEVYFDHEPKQPAATDGEIVP